MPSDQDLRLGIGAIFKNEGPYILEWVAYHRVLGFSRFFIADNNSDDGSTERLAALAAAGIIEHIPFPGEPDKAPQLPAYAEIIRRHGNDVDWLAFIDADEFFLPTDGARSLLPYFAELDALQRIGAVVVNWATYGSSGQEQSSSLPVVERFGQRGNDDWIVNHHYKTVVRTAATPRVGRTPHLVGVSAAFETIHTDGAKLANHPEKGEGISAGVIWDRLRLNHFVIKSRHEFFTRKQPRGRASIAGETRGEKYFVNHDRNEVSDPTPVWLVEATRAEISVLTGLLRDAGPRTKSTGQSPLQPNRYWDWQLAGRRILQRLGRHLRKRAAPARPSAHGAIDRISIDDQLQVSVTGWALLNERAVPFLSIRIGEKVLEDCQITRRDRPDVVRHFPNADVRSGFTIGFPLRSLREGDAPATASILARVSISGQPIEVARQTPWPSEMASTRIAAHSAREESIGDRASPANLRLGIGAIFKNEAPYILEWVAYHRVLGFSRFFIADNDSADGSTELLSALAAAGIVDHIPFPGVPDRAPQKLAYEEIIRRFGDEADWLAFIDADEFFLPTDGARSMLPLVAELSTSTSTGVVVFNWAVYGSSGHVEPSGELVTERFIRRAEQAHTKNNCYKSLVRASAGPRTRGSPHLFGTAAGLASIQTNGAPLANHPSKGEGHSAKVVWDRARLNHFVVKSSREFFERKAPKGRADLIGRKTDENYFSSHDRNEVLDPTPSWLIEATKAEIKRLEGLVGGSATETRSGST